MDSYLDSDPLAKPEYARLTYGSGSVGGKARGILFAKEKLAETKLCGQVLFPEGRFLAVGFYNEFLELNGIDDICCRDEQDYQVVQKMFARAEVPKDLTRALCEILTEMECPLAVRSSLYQEDNIKYSFAGKYLTTFVPNRGPLEKRVKQLTSAIKQIYSSTMGPDALIYRRKHGVGTEKMGIIVQRLIGKQRGRYFYPELAGVGFSRNYRRWT